MMCDPGDEYQCLMCMPGYFQNNKGNCIRVALAIEEAEEEGTGGLKGKTLFFILGVLVFGELI